MRNPIKRKMSKVTNYVQPSKLRRLPGSEHGDLSWPLLSLELPKLLHHSKQPIADSLMLTSYRHHSHVLPDSQNHTFETSSTVIKILALANWDSRAKIPADTNEKSNYLIHCTTSISKVREKQKETIIIWVQIYFLNVNMNSFLESHSWGKT